MKFFLTLMIFTLLLSAVVMAGSYGSGAYSSGIYPGSASEISVQITLEKASMRPGESNIISCFGESNNGVNSVIIKVNDVQQCSKTANATANDTCTFEFIPDIRGDRTILCEIIDAASNSAINTTILKVSPNLLGSSSSSTGSGTSSVVQPSEDSSILAVSSLPKDIVNVIKITNKEVRVKEIFVETTETARNVQIVVTKMESEPPTIKRKPRGKVFQYLTIDHSNLENEKIKSAGIKFVVDKAWISSQNAEKEQVVLKRHEEEGWRSLETRIVAEDDDEVEYEAISPGLSIYAITIEDQEETEINETEIVEEDTPPTIEDIKPPLVIQKPRAAIPLSYEALVAFAAILLIAILGYFHYHHAPVNKEAYEKVHGRKPRNRKKSRRKKRRRR